MNRRSDSFVGPCLLDGDRIVDMNCPQHRDDDGTIEVHGEIQIGCFDYGAL